MKTLVGSPEPERPRNERVVWATNGTNTTADGAGGGNVRIEWVRINDQR